MPALSTVTWISSLCLNARAVEGLDAALDRAALYIEAGADLTFVEAPTSRDEMRRIAHEAMGFALVLYANVALQGAIRGMRDAFCALATDGRMEEGPLLASFAERQRLVDKEGYDAMEHRYAG